MDKEELFEKVRSTHRHLFDEFKKWEPTFKDVRDFVYPYLGNFQGETFDGGYERRDQFLSRTTSLQYADTLASGLQNGITSPTRPWVQLSVQDENIMQNTECATWLQTVSRIIMDMLRRGKFYPNNQQFYLELGVFGTAAMFISENNKTGLSCHTFTIGEYAIGTDAEGTANQFARVLALTGNQLKEMFPDAPKEALEGVTFNNSTSNPYKVFHLICPNKDAVTEGKTNTSFKYRDYYWREGCQQFLRVSGYHEFPLMIGRWFTKGSDIYGTSPGMKALADAKQINETWDDMGMGVSMGIRPPVQAPADILSNGGINMNPSAVNLYNPMGGSDGGIKPIFEPKLDLQDALAYSQAIEECLKDHFNVKVFQLLSDMDKGTRTAREIVELSSEKMSQMGPLVDRMETEMLPQVVERALAIGFRKRLFPAPPDQLQGQNLNIQYQSILAQAQKQSFITPIVDTINQSIEWAGQAQKPEALDVIDMDEAIRTVGDYNGMPARLLVSKENVQSLRQQRAQAQQQQEQMMQAQQMADTAATASKADMGGDNALSAMVNNAKRQQG